MPSARARLTDARLVIGSVTALVLTALLGFQAGISVPPNSGTYISFLSVGRSRDAPAGGVSEADGSAGDVHRLAVLDRLYNGDASRKHLETLRLLDASRMPPFTREVQEWIWHRQNPPRENCSTSKYLLVDNIIQQGLGSTLHVAAAHLGQALQYDAIFMWDPAGQHVGQEYIDPGCGRGENYTNWDCIFEPLSWCGAEHAVENNTGRYVAFSPEWTEPYPWTFFRGPELWEQRLRQHWAPRGVTVTPHYLKVWWRAQAAAYIVRPNEPTMAAVTAMRMNTSLTHVWQGGQLQQNMSVPYPLTPGTISMHVRHGDKGSEMTLVPFEQYVLAAEKLISENPLGLKRIGFVSTEDPYVVEQAANLTRIFDGTSPDEAWVFYVCDVHRMNSGPMQQLEHFQTRSAVTVEWLYQLYMALEADVWIGTRNSNWNRLIDEMRCTFVDKCSDNIFVELSPHHEWANYHWRR